MRKVSKLSFVQYMRARIYTAQLLSRIKRVTSEYDNQSRIVWPREGTRSVLVEYLSNLCHLS